MSQDGVGQLAPPVQRGDGCVQTNVQAVAKQIEWWKLVIGAVVILVGGGATAALYMQQFATGDQVKEVAASRAEVMRAHEASEGHPALSGKLQGIDQRLIRVEVVQGRMETTQGEMNAKLDRLIESMWRVQQSSAFRDNPPRQPVP